MKTTPLIHTNWITYFSIIIKKIRSLYIIKCVLAYGGKQRNISTV